MRFQRISSSLLLAAVTVIIATLPELIGIAQSGTPVVVVSAASFDSTQPVAPDSIAAAFGGSLATQTVTAPAIDADPNLPGFQLPTTLGGTTVEVNGEKAQLFFVSPSQINFLIPRQTQSGTAQLNVRSGDGTLSQGTVAISAVAPSVFSASSTGQGVAAGSLLRVKASGEQTLEPLFQQDALGRFLPNPINLGPSGEQVFLVLYLTGIRGAVDADVNHDSNFNETIHIVIDGQVIIPNYAGIQGAFVGVDQINAEIPRNLIGRRH